MTSPFVRVLVAVAATVTIGLCAASGCSSSASEPCCSATFAIGPVCVCGPQTLAGSTTCSVVHEGGGCSVTCSAGGISETSPGSPEASCASQPLVCSNSTASVATTPNCYLEYDGCSDGHSYAFRCPSTNCTCEVDGKDTKTVTASSCSADSANSLCGFKVPPAPGG